MEQERGYKRYWAKLWYQNNKDKKREYSREYYFKNKEAILELSKERHKSYYANNKEAIALKHKMYRAQKVKCDICGSEYSKEKHQRHLKTHKHKNAVEAHNQQH